MGNYSWYKLSLQGADDPIIPAFDTPEHKFNLGLGGRNIPIKVFWIENAQLGLQRVNFKWVEGFEFQGSPQFTGFSGTYWLLDGQVDKRVDKIHTTFKLGASNIMNLWRPQVFGGPYIGRMAFFSVLVELDKL